MFTWAVHHICTVLVLFMQAGFTALEGGLSPLNNTANIMLKNLTDLSVGVLLFYLVVYSIMYGSDASGRLGLSGWGGFGIGNELSDAPYWRKTVNICACLKHTEYINHRILYLKTLYLREKTLWH